MTHPWEYYDFKKHWGAFYKVWKTDAVQTVLQREMEKFCSFPEDVYWKHWKKGDPIWELSEDNYWPDRITRMTREHIKANDLVGKYRRHYESLGKTYASEKGWYNAFSEEYFEDISKQFTPKPGTIESLICTKAEQYISFPLYTACCLLFPDDLVLHIVDRHVYYGYTVFVPSKNIIFDLYNFFNYTVNGTEECECLRMVRKKCSFLLDRHGNVRDPLRIMESRTIFQASEWSFLDDWVVSPDILVAMVKNFYYGAPLGHSMVLVDSIQAYDGNTLSRIMFNVNSSTNIHAELDDRGGIPVLRFIFFKGPITDDDRTMIYVIGDDNTFERLN